MNLGKDGTFYKCILDGVTRSTAAINVISARLAPEWHTLGRTSIWLTYLDDARAAVYRSPEDVGQTALAVCYLHQAECLILRSDAALQKATSEQEGRITGEQKRTAD